MAGTHFRMRREQSLLHVFPGIYVTIIINNVSEKEGLKMETLSGNTRSYRSLYSIVERVKSSGLVIYGAGYWGKISLRIFALFDVAPVCFCDDNLDKQGTYLIQNNVKIPVISLDEAAEKYPNAVYFSAALGGNGSARGVMNSRLKERNLISEYSGFHPARYLFLLEGGWEALKHPDKSVSPVFQIESIKNIIVTNHMGQSGTVYFNSLMDGHPNIVNIQNLGPEINKMYLRRLQYLEGEELVLETASQMSRYFSSQFPEEAYLDWPNYRLACYYHLDQNGRPEKRIYIDPVKFTTVLDSLLSGRGKVSFAVLIKAIYAAYADCIGKTFDPKQTYWMYWDWHNSDKFISELDDLLPPNEFDRIEHLYIIREPIQHLFSYFYRNWDRNHKALRSRWWLMGAPEVVPGFLSVEAGLRLEKKDAKKNKAPKIVRFEDAKRRTREIMQAMSKWMDIPFDECMLHATVNGIPVYWPSSSTVEGVISSTDTTAVDRKDFSAFMTSYDIFRLNLLFRNFKKTYGYDCDVPDYKDFSLNFLQELYKHPFHFEDYLLDAAAEAEKRGFRSPEDPSIHEEIFNFTMDYMQTGGHELIADVLWPQETEEEK